MSNKKLKILFIPADNIEANISRSYFFAKGLAKQSDLYFVTWKDYRTKQWLGGKISKLNTLICFFQSCFSSTSTYKKVNENFTRIKCSVFIDAIIGKILGSVRTKKIMRNHNAKTLNKLINKINPDVIFYADGCYFFPTQNNINAIQVCDIQDDVDWNKFPQNLQQTEKAYKKKQFENFDIHYIVSQNAKNNIIKNIGDFPFKVVYNGADFSEIQKDYTKEIEALKSKLNLHDKYIISHIGSATWVDPVFTKKLFEEIYQKDPSIVLILVGSMEKVELPNVINVGMVPVAESYIYYSLTDLALMLKNSEGSNFLYNSVPLKNIQYAAAHKPVISFPIEWLKSENFSNTTIVKDDNVQCWTKAIQSNRKNFVWNESDTNQWRNYDWDVICVKMLNELLEKSKLKN